ncbi:MAG: Chemotaxis response regulator protein-glutamate methylesterase [Turneriella sp.]|nr:Chemotaxis response regulator protein-glutamate methylesterase [Turneriella sp.]
MLKPSVLIIDPDVALQEILSEILQNRFRIFVSNSIADAKAAMQGADPDLVFIELQLPNENAIKYLEQIKRSKGNSQIIVITDNATVENAVIALRHGAFDFLKKPFEFEEIARIVEKFFSITKHREADYDIYSCIIEESRTFELQTNFALVSTFMSEIMHIISRFSGFDKKTMLTIRLSLYEMLVNAMEHGNLEIDYEMKKNLLEKVVDYQRFLEERTQQEPYRGRKVLVSYHYNTKSISFTITDEGKGFDVNKVPNPHSTENIENLSGRGIFISRVNMTRVTYNDKGNSVTLYKELSPPRS